MHVLTPKKPHGYPGPSVENTQTGQKPEQKGYKPHKRSTASAGAEARCEAVLRVLSRALLPTTAPREAPSKHTRSALLKGASPAHNF